MVTHDLYADWDAAYVLGALSVAERQEYEAHLGTCPACRDAVAELSGLPGLLAQVPLDTALSAEGPGAPGNGSALAAATWTAAHRATAPRRWRGALAAVAAALLIGLGSGYAVARLGTAEPARPPGGTATAALSGRLAFSAVAPSPMTAVVDVAALGAGSRLQVECQYASDGWEQSADPRYAVWVLGRDGSAREEFVWTARPGVVMHPKATSALPPAQIAAIEIRRADTGQVVLRTSRA